MLDDVVRQRPDLIESVNALKQQLSGNDITAIDARYAAHRYPEKALVFNRLQRYIGQFNISKTAQAVLFLLVQCSSQDNLVAIPVSVIMLHCGVSDFGCRNALKELQAKGFIALYKKAARHTPNVYMLNLNIIVSGKPPTNADYKEFEELNSMPLDVNKSDYTLSYVTIKDIKTGRFVTYGTLQEQEKKDPLVPATQERRSF